MIRTLLNRLFRLVGWQLTPIKTALPRNLDEGFLQHYQGRNWPDFTMTGAENMYALYQATHYVLKNNIPGDIVECGVWRGGNMMLVGEILEKTNEQRALWLYDTYTGMSEPTERDQKFNGIDVNQKWQDMQTGDHNEWCYASLEEVEANLKSVVSDESQLTFVKGKVEDTIPTQIPTQIALLRLDTDWYESTKHELEHLFPLVPSGGVIIIDDYGSWEGARGAVEEYLSEYKLAPLNHRIDKTARIFIKQ